MVQYSRLPKSYTRKKENVGIMKPIFGLQWMIAYSTDIQTLMKILDNLNKLCIIISMDS
jgi:hypothetical protein